jgi:hypothetical protein
MVIASVCEMNVILTSAHVSRFIAMPRLAPCARSRIGMTSALYVPASGPSSTENAAMNASTNATVTAAAVASGALMMSAAPSDAIDAATPAALARRSGRRPRRSERSAATRMKHILTTLTPTAAPSTALFDDMPAFGTPAGCRARW